MIAYIKGNIASINEDSVIVDVQGIGYEIMCANPFVFQESLNDNVLIYTYHYVREDAQLLYGFKTQDQKALFTKLLQVSGIGPKSALSILGTVNVSEFAQAVEREDDKFLTSFPGIGKKTARQVILDLKGKLTSMLSFEGTLFDNDLDKPHASNEALTEAKEALKALGYSEKEIKGIMPYLQKEELQSVDEIIRKALALLVKN